jgi:hypothetical protein
MSIYAALDRNPTRKDLLSFGLIVLAGLSAFGAHALLHGKIERGLALLAAGAAVLLLSLVRPIGRRLYILWMGLGLTLGVFTVPIVMFVLYAVAVVPLGLWFRLRGRDTMRRTIDPSAATYWEDYPGSNDPASYVRQF